MEARKKRDDLNVEFIEKKVGDYRAVNHFVCFKIRKKATHDFSKD